MAMNIDGAARAWGFRWFECCKPGHYIVTVQVGDSVSGDAFFCRNFDAVVDDFGNLVAV